MNLLGQFPGRSHHQNYGTVSSFQVILIVDVDDSGQHVTQSFAGTCLSDSHQVVALQCDRPALCLDMQVLNRLFLSEKHWLVPGWGLAL